MKSVMTSDQEHCYFCHAPTTMTHAIFGGPSYECHAMQDGLWIPICWKCKVEIHNERSQRTIFSLRRKAQLIFEETHSNDEFRKRYGKDFL